MARRGRIPVEQFEARLARIAAERLGVAEIASAFGLSRAQAYRLHGVVRHRARAARAHLLQSAMFARAASSLLGEGRRAH